LNGQAWLHGIAFTRRQRITHIPRHSPLGKPVILRLLIMDIGLKFANVAVQVVGIMKLIIFVVAKVMNIHTPFGRSSSTLRCMLGIEVQGS